MNYKQLSGNIVATIAAQQTLVSLLPPEWKPYGDATIAIAAVLAGLFQKQPQQKN